MHPYPKLLYSGHWTGLLIITSFMNTPKYNSFVEFKTNKTIFVYRPTWWSTTTLRFLEAAPVVKSGSIGSVEDAYLVPRAKKRPRIYEENFQSAASQKTSGNHNLALMLLMLIPTMLIWN